ncbi:superinfection immunity protein [Streptomyces nitrosporeus]|uniref:superinfection immunity protein n=1 Tax=Streptomyces nitrosporeus TaxID=28894 RepID=UPI00142F0B0B|nr:superinfection immunity protein [Streptomyces nitrosporeus]GGY82777.1 hypothetical protein GCM10010327_11220 [Streptomyces nitrosporeus]
MISHIGPLELLVLVLVGLLFLAVPPFIAHRRGVRRLWLVVVVSVIGAFTGLFWFVALFMALAMPARDSGPVPLPER